MPSILKSLRLLADDTRLRLLLLLRQEELSVAELCEILGMGQSRISSHLAQLRTATTRPHRVARAPRAAPTDASDVPLEPNASEDPDAPKKRRRRRRRRGDADVVPPATD